MAKKTAKKTVVKSKKAAKAKPLKKASKKAIPKKKAGKSRGGNETVDLECFLSTACIQHKNLSDNCTELQLLRNFRDNYMRQSGHGQQLVQEYYSIGPILVRAIEQDAKKASTYHYIYSCIQNACEKIRLQENKKAQAVYTQMVKRLSKKYKAVL